jgi:hypothetical protein
MEHYYEQLQVAARTGPEKVHVCYARDEDWNPVILKGPLPDREISAMLESERIKKILGLPRTNVRQDGNYVVADCLYDYDYHDSHLCRSGLDRGCRISNLRLRMWKHETNDPVTERSFLKALAFRLIVGTDDTVPRNFVLINQTVYSVDDPAWNLEPKRLWKLTSHSQHYADMLDRHWAWVKAFLYAWSRKKGLGEFCYTMIEKYQDRKNWVF